MRVYASHRSLLHARCAAVYGGLEDATASARHILAVAREHPLAERESISFEELADHAIPRLDGWPRELHESLFPTRTPSGRPTTGVRIPVGARNFLEIAHRVARQELVLPTVASVAPYTGMYDLASVPIIGMDRLESALVWRRRKLDPRLREFIRIARDVLRTARRNAG